MFCKYEACYSLIIIKHFFLFILLTKNNFFIKFIFAENLTKRIFQNNHSKHIANNINEHTY